MLELIVDAEKLQKRLKRKPRTSAEAKFYLTPIELPSPHKKFTLWFHTDGTRYDTSGYSIFDSSYSKYSDIEKLLREKLPETEIRRNDDTLILLKDSVPYLTVNSSSSRVDFNTQSAGGPPRLVASENFTQELETHLGQIAEVLNAFYKTPPNVKYTLSMPLRS